MKKVIITYLILSLLIFATFANPVPEGGSDSSSSNKSTIIIAVISVITFGLGYILYKVFTNNDVVEFNSEEIDVTINENNSVNVTGLYNFKRTGKSIKTFKVIYPFPKQDEFGKIEIESVKINGEEANYNKFDLIRRNQISLNLNFSGNNECELFISFSQKSSKPSYMYILKSTRKWKKELEKSIINVTLPTTFKLESNYHDLALTDSENLKKYQMINKDFYPNKDFLISWILR